MADTEAWSSGCTTLSDCQPESADWGLAGMLLKLCDDRLSLRAETKDLGDEGVAADSADAWRSMRALRGLSLLAADPLLMRDSGSAHY